MVSPQLWRFDEIMAPILELQNLRREMNKVFSGISPEMNREFPALNVWLGTGDAIVSAEIPGVDGTQINISVIGDSLTISGVREPTVPGEGGSYRRQERSSGRFTRTIQLPFSVEADKVDARYEKGILTIRLPRREADKPKKIEIKTE